MLGPPTCFPSIDLNLATDHQLIHEELVLLVHGVLRDWRHCCRQLFSAEHGIPCWSISDESPKSDGRMEMFENLVLQHIPTHTHTHHQPRSLFLSLSLSLSLFLFLQWWNLNYIRKKMLVIIIITPYNSEKEPWPRKDTPRKINMEPENTAPWKRPDHHFQVFYVNHWVCRSLEMMGTCESATWIVHVQMSFVPFDDGSMLIFGGVIVRTFWCIRFIGLSLRRCNWWNLTVLVLVDESLLVFSIASPQWDPVSEWKKIWFQGPYRSLKLTASSHLKMDGWNTILSYWGRLGLFSGANLLLVSRRVTPNYWGYKSSKP